MMCYKNTFILVAPDCPVTNGIVPVAKKEKKTVHQIQYELLTQYPYTFNHEDLIYEVHIRHKDIPLEELEARANEIRAELFHKPHPCLRASMLPKKYGWGFHYDGEGRIAIYAMDSSEYKQFVQDRSEEITLLLSMRNKRSV